jgi:uncharacterized protein
VKELFADSFYWIALLNPYDGFHASVQDYSAGERLVTSLAVQLEVLDAFSGSTYLRKLGGHFWEGCRENSNITVIPLDTPLLDQAVQLYQSRPDKTWSCTDCISFVIMRQRMIKLALTADQHFQQAGFEIAFSQHNT